MSDVKLKRNSKHLYITILFLALAVGFIGVLVKGLSFDTTVVPPATLGKPAQDFKVAWVQGQEFLKGETTRNFRLADFKGKKTILNFWASWCVSCRTEAHELEMFWQKHGKEFHVVGIAIQDEVSSTKAFIKRFGKTYIIGLDEDGKAAIDYGVSGVPESFILSEDGRILDKITGPVTLKLLEDRLKI